MLAFYCERIERGEDPPSLASDAATASAESADADLLRAYEETYGRAIAGQRQTACAKCGQLFSPQRVRGTDGGSGIRNAQRQQRLDMSSPVARKARRPIPAGGRPAC